MAHDDYLEWDEYFMAEAFLATKRSRDPNTRVGACIVGPDNKIKAKGYNGFPRGISDKEFPWAREGGFLETKYAFMCHAEANAIDNRGSNALDGCRIYVTLFPCNECAKRIIQNGIIEIIYWEDKYADKEDNIASKMLFKAAGVKTRRLSITKNISLETKNE